MKKQNRKSQRKKNKNYVTKKLESLFEGRERVLNAFGRKIFPIKIESNGFLDKVSDHCNLKILYIYIYFFYLIITRTSLYIKRLIFITMQ